MRKPAKTATKAASRPKATKSRRLPSKPLVIDIHAHIVVPEVAKVSQQYNLSHASAEATKKLKLTKKAAAFARKWGERNRERIMNFDVRVKDMDKAGVDIQVLTTSLIHQSTHWADGRTAAALERKNNDYMADIIARYPGRFIGLGGVPLQAPKLAVKELERCMNELNFVGVQISSTAGNMELGDKKLEPFWAAAEKLGAAIYIHPAGVMEQRYIPHQLWNSIGQPLEEAMAMASLFYEGVTERYPKLKVCIAHGGGYLPYYAGRVDRNYYDKPHTRGPMKVSPSQYMKKSFYYDSCVYNEDMLEYLAKKVGPRRIILGSDYPVGEDDPVGFVRKTKGLSRADQDAILGRNAVRMFGIRL